MKRPPSPNSKALRAVFHTKTGEAERTKPKKPKPKSPPPFSLRLSNDERAYLEALAGNQPLGAYIRETLLVERANKRKTLRKPHINDQKIAEVLAALGDTRLSSNLNQLAKHANMGTIDVSLDTEKELEYAYQAILAMRNALFMALGMDASAGGGE